MVKEHSSRRKSIAGTNQNRPSGIFRDKRRAHSIVPGDILSPRAKARRLAAPRKSILKSTTNSQVTPDEPTSQDVQPLPQAQFQFDPPAPSPETTTIATQSMDLTTDFQTQIHDNPSRKSLGRRVSFASNAHVRLIDRVTKDDNTMSTASPQSSPIASSDPVDDGVPRPVVLSDENAYPGAAQRNRRRSSIRQSMGSDDMDLTATGSDAFLFAQDGSALADESMSFDDDSDMDMDVTEALDGEFIRKRPVSLGGARKPLAQISIATPSAEADQSQSFTDQSQSSASDQSQEPPTEFTIPLNRSLRPPAHEDETWMALRRMTHSGDTPYEEPPMSSDDEYVPVAHGGDRLASASGPVPAALPHDETFSSADDDSFGDADNGDRTMNLSKVMGRVSMAGGGPRMSVGQPDSTMDESEIYGSIIPPPAQSTPVARKPSIPEPSRPSIFRPPSPSKTTTPAPASPSKTTTTPAPTSPSKGANKPTFTAAFAPKVVPLKRPVTDAPPAAPKRLSLAPKPAVPSPSKRPRDPDDDTDKPSPAKRLALAGKWRASTGPVVAETRASTPPTDAPKPKPLSPSKRAPFLAQTQTPAAASTSTAAPRQPSALRRPSGYFARRKSMGVGLGVPDTTDKADAAAPASAVGPKSPKKKAGVGLGRVSMGSAPSDAWTRFDRTAAVPAAGKENGKGKGKEKEPAAESEAVCAREAERQAAASPTPSRGSPAPNSPHPASPRSKSPSKSAEVSSPVIDLSTLLESAPEFGAAAPNMDVGPTEQWRDGVEEADFLEEEEVRISIEQFFDLTGIKFMDELDAPRRSIHQPSRQPRPPAEIPLAEYAVAMSINVPELVLYSAVSTDLQGWIDKSKSVFAQAEEEAAEMTPELFTEYMRADEEGQAELLHQLNLIRTNARGLAKSDWYDWKLRWIEGLREAADEGLEALRQDAATIEQLRTMPDEVLPALEREYEEIMRELEQQQAEVAEIENSDQDYLTELKASIAEQNVEVEALQAEVAESDAQLQWLQERLEELELEKRGARTAIADANRILHIQKNSTHAELSRLKEELNNLQDLHMFRATKVLPELFEYEYASQFRVSVPCRNFAPINANIEISRLQSSRSLPDDFPVLSRYFLDNAARQIPKGKITTRQVVESLADYWSACSQVRTQLIQLTIKYPVEIEVLPSGQGFRAKAIVMFPAVKAKAYIYFTFSPETYSRWPISIGFLRHDIQVIYGAIDQSSISTVLSERLDQIGAPDNYGCLLDACIGAQELY
ncbi:Spc7 kinetochore protein-domain-containing protein [Mycena albidolilacea]|uniref:Spc7 kinetochore protein-domain-containing protein n=1 Tax=Mycena albidolilacea TaxID=1033008 RepID=A0AAD7EZV8_9AGAR|nr:Spc7 kinetochore protein-domain-containing protein [Mycena albidolilacea]